MSSAKLPVFKKSLPLILIIGGALGLLASMVLVIEEIHLLENPDVSLGCDLNPIVSCSSSITNDQGRILGFPNAILGIGAFAAVITIGFSIVAGAKYKRWFWQAMQLGVTAGVFLVHWFIFQAIYNLGSLCPYCMLTWLVVIPIFFYVTLFNIQEKNIRLNPQLKSLINIIQRNHLTVIVGWFVVIGLLILEHFWYYWETVI